MFCQPAHPDTDGASRAEFVRSPLGIILASVICVLHGCELELNDTGSWSDGPSSKVSIRVFEPVKSNGCAVIIFPGGGYSSVEMGYEGSDPARWLNSRGITAFVVQYNLGRAPAPMNDGRRAVRWVRHNAAKHGLDVEKIGVWGFSAGGHLASTVCTHFDTAGEYGDEVDEESARPSFCILWYPVISMEPSLTHWGSRNNLLGRNPSAEQVRYYSNEIQVTRNTPPCFLVHSRDDEIVSVENTIVFNNALREREARSEMHLSDYGGHGHGLSIGTDKLDVWLAQFKVNTLADVETSASAAETVDRAPATVAASAPALTPGPGS